MEPKDGVTLVGTLASLRWEGDEVRAMDWIFDTAERRGVDFIGGLDADAEIDGETGLRHYTYDGVAVFFRYGNRPAQLYVYAVGRHTGNDNKKYKLYTFSSGTKAKRYTF